ncbi:MAG: zf-HC2 domain-containing protein [Acidobacteria bacterium]|nr:zf-HC2 domain-containing protein [Acidobacteriota bacterium]
MNCAEFQDDLPQWLEGDRKVESEAHLRTCPACHELIADFDFIRRAAGQLQESAEPSPRVWNSIAIALRQEGLIRDGERESATVTVFPRPRGRWLNWLAPIAALGLIAFSLWTYQNGSPESAGQSALPPKVQTASMSLEDRQLLDMISARMPSLRQTYESDLQDVNAYIQDAEQSVHSNPNDEEAQESLMQAYEQRAMLYEMALNRSLP